MSTTCSSQIFQQTSPHHRYFNLPIEQIPGWDSTKDQILVHGDDAGLYWANLECLSVVTCIKLESNTLIAERKNIVIVKAFDTDNCSIEVQECPPPTESGTL